MEKAVAGEGLTCTRRRSVTGFTQLEISDGSEVCRVDLAYDARIRPIEQTPLAATLALEELAADKVLALFSRAQARDFIDVAALAERFGWPRLYELAAEKDPGFDRFSFLDALRAFDRLRSDDFDLDAHGYERLQRRVRQWCGALARDLDRERGRKR